jgi:hypothetical protein
VLPKVHFLKTRYWAGLHADLLGQKLKHWFDKVLIEIKIIMSHFQGEHQKALSLARIMKLLGLVEGYQRILLSMNYKGRAHNFLHLF